MTFDGGPARGELGTSDLLWTYSPLQPAKRVYLAPGQLFASGDHVQVTTILGSCVAEDTGGDFGRKLIFEVQTCSARVRAIDANSRQ